MPKYLKYLGRAATGDEDVSHRFRVGWIKRRENSELLRDKRSHGRQTQE